MSLREEFVQLAQQAGVNRRELCRRFSLKSARGRGKVVVIDDADDFMAGNAGVDGGHHAAPLVAELVEIGVTDAAIQNFDLYVVFGGVAPRDRGGG